MTCFRNMLMIYSERLEDSTHIYFVNGDIHNVFLRIKFNSPATKPFPLIQKMLINIKHIILYHSRRNLS